MGIKKQEFYEGAAVYLLARSGQLENIRYESPFFRVNDKITLLLKYSTRKRSPWGFTFTIDEQNALESCVANSAIIGLICGSDGVVSLPYAWYLDIAAPRNSAIHISCYRGHNKHYEINGPDGTLNKKVAPSDWRRLLGPEVKRI
jgi:hypothetical protein